MSDNNQAPPSNFLEPPAVNQSDVFQSPKKIKKVAFRKRRYTVGSDVFKYQSKKRRKDNFGPPTVFLLGGNIHDPLNLKSIESNTDGQNHITPESSPLPISSYKSKVEVLIPANIRDPLNLAGSDSHDDANLISPTNFKNNNKRNKRRRTSSETELFEKQSELRGFSDKKFKDDSFLVRRNTINFAREKLSLNKLVPTPANSQISRPSRNFNSTKISKDPKESKETKKTTNETKNQQQRENAVVESSKQERFQYGNYNRYYGYRNIQECDPRIELFQKDLFKEKDVLDIGCNIGHVTLTIARDFAPRKIVGIDIDPKLISIATKNIRHYVTEKIVGIESFPISMPILFGPIPNMPSQCKQTNLFPHNVFFATVNYVPENDECLANERAEYDCILCLSLTKWVHLNWGDAGVKRLFHRIFLHLRPGGLLILEPQSWSTYNKKAKLTPQTLETFRSIRFKPEQFNEYLLKDIGFKSCELLGTPEHSSKGFQRPIYLYMKAKV